MTRPLLMLLSAVLIAFVMGSAGPSTHAQSGDQDRRRSSDENGARQSQPEEPPKPKEISYKVEISGLDEHEELKKGVREVSQLVELKDRRPYSIFQLEDRAKGDLGRARNFLRSRGYYAARVRYEIEDSTTPIVVKLIAVRGPPYKLAAFDIEWRRPGAPEIRLSRLGVTLGEQARAQTVVDAQSALLVALADSGYPFAKVANRRVVVDHAKRIMRVTLTIDRGRAIRFGDTEIIGADNVDRGLIRRRLEWVRGGRYSTDPVQDSRTKLFDVGVFSSVLIEPDESRIGPDGRTPMVVRLKERKPRSIALSAFYDTSLGPGGEVEWLHRNLFGGAERLTVRVGGTFTEYGVKAFFRKPDIFEGPQDLLVEARYQELDAPAYEGREAVGALAIERRFGEHLSVKAGPVVDWSSFDTDRGQQNFMLFGAIAGVTYSAVDREIDPLRGYRLTADAAPYVGDGLIFAHIRGRANGYWTPPILDDRLTLAGWTRLGAVVGEERDALPPNKRLYAGGGSSIRGFGYQRIGPLDSANNPIGGRSSIELGLEARFRVTGEWGGVLFFEGGNVYPDLSPDFSSPFRWGVGIGVRYKSPIGLLRLDLATPLNRRTGDSILQVYISIGQAF